ncbi:MAG TPA: YncE family protein [Bryobacteraceae bacterium]|nr:YncE family protein [Bryobacteraceae bacterium]
MKKVLTLALIAATAFAAEGYRVLNKIKIGGTGGWDYTNVDSAAGRLYASHGTEVDVVDLNSGKVVGKIEQLHGVHGIALAPELGKGFISNGQSNSVTVFDLKTLAKTGEPATGTNPDAICYEPKTRRVFTFNGRSGDSTAIDAKTNEIAGTFKLGGKPEFCAADGAGKIYNNLEDTSEVIEIDAAKLTVLRRASLAPAEGPSGLAIDTKNKKLFSVCDNKMMAVVDIPTMKVIATPAIGSGPDAAGFDPGTGLAFSSNGTTGTLTIVKPVNGKYEAVDTVTTERGARTMTVDTKLHRVYLLAAEYGPTPASKEGQKRSRAPILPDSFHVLVVGK